MNVHLHRYLAAASGFLLLSIGSAIAQEAVAVPDRKPDVPTSPIAAEETLPEKETPQADTANPPNTSPATEPAIQPEAVGVLTAMATHLRGLGDFRLTALTTQDMVLEDGQKIEISGELVFEVRPPNRLKLTSRTDAQHRIYYYDGKSVTQYAPSLGYYAVFDGADTIADTIVAAEERYALQIPLADLFFWGTPRSNVRDLKSALLAGRSQIGGSTCNHYVYRTDSADFQVWIREHSAPMPCRLVVTTMDDPARPDFTATLEWDLRPTLTDTMFSFAPPGGVQKITHQPVQDAQFGQAGE